MAEFLPHITYMLVKVIATPNRTFNANDQPGVELILTYGDTTLFTQEEIESIDPLMALIDSKADPNIRPEGMDTTEVGRITPKRPNPKAGDPAQPFEGV